MSNRSDAKCGHEDPCWNSKAEEIGWKPGIEGEKSLRSSARDTQRKKALLDGSISFVYYDRKIPSKKAKMKKR